MRYYVQIGESRLNRNGRWIRLQHALIICHVWHSNKIQSSQKTRMLAWICIYVHRTHTYAYRSLENAVRQQLNALNWKREQCSRIANEKQKNTFFLHLACRQCRILALCECILAESLLHRLCIMDLILESGEEKKTQEDTKRTDSFIPVNEVNVPVKGKARIPIRVFRKRRETRETKKNGLNTKYQMSCFPQSTTTFGEIFKQFYASLALR